MMIDDDFLPWVNSWVLKGLSTPKIASNEIWNSIDWNVLKISQNLKMPMLGRYHDERNIFNKNEKLL